MSMRGGGRGRGLGRPRGSKNKLRTQLYEYTNYKPEPEVYEELFRLRNEPPVITRSLPKQCPIPNAESSILSRRQVESTSRYYYNVRIVYESDEVKTERASTGPHEEVAQIEMSQILKYVSRRELERFEQEDYRQIAEAEEVDRRTEAEEAAKRRLLRNAKPRGRASGDLTTSGPVLDIGEVSIRTRGRPRGRGRGRGGGRGRGRGRGWAIGRGGLASAAEQVVDSEDLDTRLSDQKMLESAITNASESEEDGDELNLSGHPSPNFAISSFVANSALPLSPVAAHRRLSKTMPMHNPRAHESHPEYNDTEEDPRSMSSAATQLQFERDIYGRQFHSDDEIESEEEVDDEERQRIKRRRTESTTSTSALPAALQAQQSDDNSSYEHPLLARRPAPQRQNTGVDGLNPKPQDHGQRFGDNNEDIDVNDARDGEYDEEYVVETIMSHSYEDGKRYYLVKWAGYEDSSDWLPEKDLADAQELVDDYNARVRKNIGKQTVR
ncbi:hypothetical protein DPSP01_002274 [Paraphaeosphaeria sporulosa]